MLTIGDLRELIEALDLDDDVEIRMAQQPRWAMEYSAKSAELVLIGKDEEPVLYIEEGPQLGYLSDEVQDAFGWGNEK